MLKLQLSYFSIQNQMEKIASYHDKRIAHRREIPKFFCGSLTRYKGHFLWSVRCDSSLNCVDSNGSYKLVAFQCMLSFIALQIVVLPFQSVDENLNKKRKLNFSPQTRLKCS